MDKTQTPDEIRLERMDQIRTQLAELERTLEQRQKDVSRYFRDTEPVAALKREYEAKLDEMQEQVRLSAKQKRRLKNLADICQSFLKSRNTD